MKTKVQKWGNSLGVRIPKSFSEEAKLDEGCSVEIVLDNDRIIIKSLKPNYELNDLLKQINSNNIHREVDTGREVGQEIW